MSISVLLPAYKEAENIPMIAPRLHDCLKKLNIPYEILVLDTEQPLDNTKELCAEFQLTYCSRLGGNDYGDAIRTGLAQAQYSYSVVMDCDGSHNPEDIAAFWALKETADLVIGSRYVRGGKTDNPPILVAMSWVVNTVYRIVLGINAKDISNSFRMYRTEQVKNIPLECSNFDLVEEILIKLCLNYPQLKISEIPITFAKRNAGKSKRNLLKFMGSYIATLFRLYRIKIKHSRHHNV